MSKASYLSVLLTFVASLAFGGELVKMKNGILHLPAHAMPASGPTNVTIPRFFPTLNRVFYIIQFDGPVQNSWKEALEAGGVTIGSYLPDDAFLAKVDTDEAWMAVNGQSHVRAVAPFDTDLRVSQDLPPVTDSDTDLHEKVVVKVAFAEEAPAFLKSMQGNGIPVVVDLASDDFLVLETTLGNVRRIADIEGVEWVEPYNELHMMDVDDTSFTERDASPRGPGDYSDITGYESGTKLMNFDSAYARGFNGDGEVIGIADTGLDRGSLTDILDDFKGQISAGYALGLFSRSWDDPQGHGTHTSGSIVGDGALSHGKIHGGAMGARLVMQGMWSPMLNNLSIIPDFDKLFGVARRNDGVHIHSNSWGSPRTPGVYDNFAAMVDALSWRYPDLLIVFAAGNDGADANGDGHIDENSISTPATAKDCLTVGASKNLVLKGGIQKPMKELRGGNKKWDAEPIASSRLSDNPNGIAAFSSVGPTMDGRIKPEIVAPGTNIISTRSLDPKASTLWGAYNDDYVYAGGTSMATPLTAGAAAVVREYLRHLGFEDPSAALIKAVMLYSATDLFPGQFGTGKYQEFKTRRPNVNEGWGRVDVGAGTALAKSALVEEDRGLKTGESKVYSVEMKAGEWVHTVLTYTDAPASAGAAQALVNQIDVTIVDPSGQVHYPNHLSGPDRANNTKNIEFRASMAGTYQVVVSAHNVPKGRDDTGAQPYALVLPGAL